MHRVIVPVLVSALVSGCYSNSVLHGSSATSLQRGGYSRAIVLRDVRGRRLHLDPRSRLRFYRRDGLWTAWVYARDLRVNQEGVYRIARRGGGTMQGLRWADVQGIEVKNLSGGKTYGAVVGTTIIIAAVVIIVVAMMAGKGGGGGGSVKLPRLRGVGRGLGRGVGRGLGRAAGGLARAAARTSYTLARAWSHGWHWYGPPIRVHIHAPSTGYSSPPGHVPPAHTPPPGTQPLPGANGNAGAPPPPPPAPGAQTPPASGPLSVMPGRATPLFTRAAVRRSRIRFVTTMEGGSDFTLDDRGGTWGGFVGIRLRDIFEIGGGARLQSFKDPDALDPDATVTQWTGFGRFLMHFVVDPWRRVGLPFGIDVGGGHPAIYARILLGLRVRVFADLSLGIYPFNPTYTYVKGPGGQRGYSGWTFPTTFEVSYAF